MALALASLAPRPAAQEVTGAALKAAFIYNFAKFTDWPADALPAKGPFTMCVAGDGAVADALERMVKGRDRAGLPIGLQRVGTTTPLRTCQILYIAHAPSNRADALLAEVAAQPVLTISDIDGFTKRGGVVELYFDRGHLRLYIETEAVNRARLKISSRLLQLSNRP